MSAIGKNGGGRKAKVVDAVLPPVGKKVRLSDTATAGAAKQKSKDNEPFAKYMQDAELKWPKWDARAGNRFYHLSQAIPLSAVVTVLRQTPRMTKRRTQTPPGLKLTQKVLTFIIFFELPRQNMHAHAAI